MPIHPMFRVVLESDQPGRDKVYRIEIAYPVGAKRFHDWKFTSETEARAAIPGLQATGRLPTDAELNGG